MSAFGRMGQFVMIGFDGTVVPAEVRSIAREFDLAGFVLFARNVEAPEQVADLVHDLRQLGGDRPLWIGVDQEGGRVARLRRPFTEWPPMAALGRSGDESLARRFASALARELALVGVSLNFAPVVDVNTNAANPVIGDRALSDSPAAVGRLGAAIVRGLQARGVAACGKHFPGHGDTSVDSHRALPVVEHRLDRLGAVEFVPFRAAIEAGVASIMMAHLLVPALDAERPASLSRALIQGQLRETLGFDGLVVTDDVEMKGCADTWPADEATVAAVEAGCDLVLICGTDHDLQAAALEALVRAAESGRLPFRTIDDSWSRHRRAVERFVGDPLFPLDPAWRPPSREELRAAAGCDAHRAIADEMAGSG